MPIAVATQPSGSPPANQITITSSDGSAITAVTLTRTANGATTPTRVQPAPGPSPLVLSDYEAPWETAVTYSVTLTRTDGTTESASAGSVNLAPTIPWMIHPTTPALSMPLDQNDFDKMGVVSIGDESREAQTTKHRILGAEYQIVTKTGPRAAVTFDLTIATVTQNERARLSALLRDQTPLLIQVPYGWGWDWDFGYYDVADYGLSRLIQYGGELRRTASLHLERVEAPAGTQQAIRTWANVLAQNATWNAVAAGYATWTDLLTDMRR